MASSAVQGRVDNVQLCTDGRGRVLTLAVTDPLADPRWHEFTARSPLATVFHGPAWLRALHDAYGFDFQAFVAERDGVIEQGLVSASLGSRRVSLPFSDYGWPLIDDEAAGRALLDLASRVAPIEGTIEVRGAAGLRLEDAGFVAGKTFLRHHVLLDRPFEQVEGGFHASARRAVRKAERAGVTVRRSTSEDDLRRFYDLVVETRRRQRLLPQPWRFFRAIQRRLFDRGLGFLLLAEHQGRLVAGDLLLVHGRTLTYKFNASDSRYLDLRPNNLLVQAAIAAACDLGCEEFDLGRCDLDGDGLRRFKLLWGSEEGLLTHFHSPALPSADRSALPSLLPRFVERAPSWALRRAGDVLYRRFA